MTARVLATGVAVVLLAGAAGCGSSDSGPATVTRTVATVAAVHTTTTAPPTPTSGGSDATSHAAGGQPSTRAFATASLGAVTFTYQGFHYKMEMQTADLNVEGEDVTLGTAAPHGYVWVVGLFIVTNADDRPVPDLDAQLAPDAQVRERFASPADRQEAVAVEDDNCQQGWCGVHNAIASGVIEDGQFNATPCSSCTMGVGSQHQIKAAYQVREGLRGSDIRFFVPDLAPIGGDYSRPSRRLD